MTNRRLSTGATVLVIAAAGLLVALVAAHTTPSGYHTVQQTTDSRQLGNPVPVRLQGPVGQVGGGRRNGESHVHTPYLEILIVIAVAVAILIGRWLYGRHAAAPEGASAASENQSPDELEAPDVQGARLAQAVAESLAELERWPVRDAIIACWLRLHETTDAMGVNSPASDTPEDFVRRVLAAARVRPESLDRLAWLYREARFSTHVMTDADRAEARRVLESIRADLGKVSYA